MTTINAQTIINAVMQAHAVAPLNKDAGFFDKIKFQTSARGFHSILNCQENLQKFADLVRKNARFFGGGLIKEAKPRAAVSWPASLISLFKQSIEDADYLAALDLGDKLGAMFYVCGNGQAYMQVAPIPCETMPGFSSVMSELGHFSLIEPVSMRQMTGSMKRSRSAQIALCQEQYDRATPESKARILSDAESMRADQSAIRAQWCAEHGLPCEAVETPEIEEPASLGDRFEAELAKRKATREAQAAQDVAQVVAQAVAAAAISEAMQPSEAADSRELVTCEAGDNEANAPSMGSASTAPAWQPVPQYMPPVPSSTDFGQSKPPAFRGNDLPECGDDAPTPQAMESQPAVVAPSVETIQAAPDTLESFDSSGDGVSGELCDAIDRATVAQVQALTPDQFARLYSHLENWNFHTENYMLQALRLGDSSIIADMRQIVADQNAAGCLHGDVYTRRLAITARMDAIKQAQDAPTIKSKSGNWNAWLFITAHGTFGLCFESKTIGNVDSTHGTAKERMTYLTTAAKSADFVPPNPPGKTEGREGSPVQISTPKPVETFKQAGPVRVDLASMIAKGVAPEALIGLGVYCKGDMANPSGSGAITGFSHSDFYGLVVDVTLESGKVWRAVRTGKFLTGWFSLDAKMHGAPYLAQLAATVALLKASASATKEQAGNARAKALIDLAEQYPQLKRAETSYAGGKLAAANMRILLKAAFKGVKFSVTSDYNSVRVNWEDGPTDDQVNEVVGRFDIGASDAHSDYFYTVSTAFSDLFGGVQYLHTRRHESDALVQQAIDELYQNRDEKPTVQDYRKCSGVFNWDGQNYENRRMRELMNSTPAFSATKSHAKS